MRPHERTQPPLVKSTAKAIQADGFLGRPILVESKHHVILDGHHRWEALKVLGCSKIPVYLVEYADDGIGLTTWPGAIVSHVTKEEVVDRGLRGDLFPPKTTRHLVQGELPDVRVPLEDLR
ncbi:MAG: ParB N-terminal domain-containing protein [Euryarchaeota archaeon]|nr:ParB N-terminal domain-containing protein [Euryarchaeota archaeon]